jgi:hypothetical protein
MFSFSMFKSMDKMAFVLLIPLCTVALMIDHPLTGFHQPYSTLNWLNWLFSMFVSAVALVLVVDYVVVYIDTYTFEDCVLPFAGLLFLAFSLYSVSNFYRQLPPSPFGPAWHLAAGCYGFTLFRRNVPRGVSREDARTS